MVTWAHESIQANGIKIHYVTAGQGPLLILLHGFPEFWYAWRHQIPLLAEHFKVVAPDLRGYNETERPLGISDYRSEIIIEDLHQLIKQLGYEKAHVAGHDWGGAIAWRAALEKPEIIDRLVVLNAPYPSIFLKALRSDFKQMKKSWYIFFFQLPYLPELLFKYRGKNGLQEILRGTAFQKQAFSNEDIEKYFKAFQSTEAITAALNYYRAAFSNKSKSEKSQRQISAPTLLIWGEKDKALGKELTFGMEPYFSGTLRVEYLEDSGHWSPEEQPEKVSGLILQHLN